MHQRKGTYRAERNFGLIVGGILTGLSGWWLYRGNFAAVAPFLLGFGAMLLLFGLIYPRALVIPNRLWMKLAEALSFVMTRVILAIVFFAMVTPLGVFKRLRGWDPLRRRAASEESYWKSYRARQADPLHYEKMF